MFIELVFINVVLYLLQPLITCIILCQNLKTDTEEQLSLKFTLNDLKNEIFQIILLEIPNQQIQPSLNSGKDKQDVLFWFPIQLINFKREGSKRGNAIHFAPLPFCPPSLNLQ